MQHRNKETQEPEEEQVDPSVKAAKRDAIAQLLQKQFMRGRSTMNGAAFVSTFLETSIANRSSSVASSHVPGLLAI